MSGILAEGGYQEFTLKSGEWAVLYLSIAAALIAIAVGFYLAKSVMAADAGSPKMQEIAKAIQEGALAYLKRQFKTIAVILVPLAIIVFVTSKAVIKPDTAKTVALSFAEAGTWRTLAFILGCLASGFTGYIGMTLATRPELIVMHEIWAGLLILLSLGSAQRGRTLKERSGKE